MEYDLLITGAKVYLGDGRGWAKADLGLREGKIAAILRDGPGSAVSSQTVSAEGCMLLPGLVDFHTHVYWGGTPLGINPDKLAPLTGVTTWVDMGSAGAGNFEGLYHHVLRRSSLNIFCFLHLSYIGLVPVGDTRLRFGELFDPRLADAEAAARACAEFPDAIKGLKIRIGMESALTEGMAYLDMALALGEKIGLPLAVHATSAPPATAKVLSSLRPGDIFTHCFSSSHSSGILDARGRLLPEAREARARGVLFDLGYGARSFDSETARLALDQGFVPDFVSSDLHAYSLGSTISGLPDAMAALCLAGLSLEEAIEGATSRPAGFLGLCGGSPGAAPAAAGRIDLGSPADLCLLRWSDGEAEFLDGAGRAARGPRLEVLAAYRGGRRLEYVDDGRKEGRWKPGLVARKER